MTYTLILPKYRLNPDKIDEKWDKNKNNGFGLGPHFLNQNQLKLANKFLKSGHNLK